MTIDVEGVSDAALVAYRRIPVAFEVRAVFDVAAVHRQNGFTFSERPGAKSYVQGYDAIAEIAAQWPGRFDTALGSHTRAH